MSARVQNTVAALLEEKQTFVTQIDKNANNVYGGPWSDAYATVTVTWTADVEFRDWGIEGILIEVIGVHADIETEIWDEENDDIVHGTVVIDWPRDKQPRSDDPKEYAMDVLDNWKVSFSYAEYEWAGSRQRMPSISPESVTIDYKKRTIEIEF